MKELFVVKWSFLIPLLPLLGAVIAGFACTGRRKKLAHWPIWLTVGAAAVMAITLLFQAIGLVNNAHSAAPDTHGTTAHVTHDAAAVTTTPINGELSTVRHFYTWIEAGSFVVNAGFYFDTLTVVMLCVICGIGFFITVFAKGYMLGEEGYFRFFAYLGLFIFAMTILVLGENLILLYLGWEGVGLCSYLLIGYYYDKPAAREAAKKAFLVNRIGDFGFGLGIMLSFLAFGTVSYFGPVAGAGGDGLLELAAGSLTPFQQTAMDWIPFLLMIGAFGKSAQFPLYVWLPDAMEGPTPVSALIHAATMVTAGVYMIARCGVLFVSNDAAMLTIACVGAFTAIFAASIALRQFDLKKVFAYSTVSQLGFMFVAVGCLAPVAGVFHLITHAFFKALLFLSSGVVMHAMLGHLDMRRMSGLKRVLPLTRWLILIGCLALAGFPLFSGFFSKDEIVAAAWHRAPLLGIIMLVTAFMTAYYTFRLYFRVFEGPELVPTEPAEGHHSGGHDDHGHDAHGHDAHGHDAHGHDAHAHHNHEPAVMMIPLIVLAIGALVAGYLNFPKHALGDFLGSSPSFIMAYDHAAAHHNPTAVDESHVVNPVVFGQTDTRSHEIQEQEHHSHWNFMVGSGVISIVGIGLAFVLHLKQRALSDKIARSFTAVTSAMENKFWIDELYDAVIVNPLRQFGRILFMIDRIVVDGIVWLIGFIPQFTGFVLRLTAQNGYLQGYALQMVIGIAVILLLVFVSF